MQNVLFLVFVGFFSEFSLQNYHADAQELTTTTTMLNSRLGSPQSVQHKLKLQRKLENFI